MVTIARDINCPKCDYPETYQELSDDGSIDTAPVAEKVAVELSREDWADVHSAVDAALSIRWHSDPEKRARVLAAIAPAAATKEV